MKRLLLSMAALPLVIGGLSVTASAADGVNVLSDLKVQGEIRPRYEMVDDNNAAHAKANAYTARTKLTVTGKLLDVEGLTASVGIISVNNFGSHEYNWNTSSYNDGSKPYATVMDPQKAMISNAEINYKTGDTLLHAGRGQVNLDNQRFIGTVGWRQLERSYDSVFVANNSIKNLSVLAAWVYGFQGVNDAPTTDTNTVLLHAAYKVNDALNVTAYDYMIATFADTYGLALTGKTDISGVKLDYRAEYAQQGDASLDIHSLNDTNGTVGTPGSEGQADAYYYNLDLGANISGVLAGVNYEFLSGSTGTDNKTQFSTPLATGHKFNGWADKFLSTPLGGLVDANVRLGYQTKDFGKFLVVYHDFTADKKMAGLDDLGTEFDILYANKIPGVKNLSGLLKYADYSKGTVAGYTADTQKFWAELDYKFSF
jgi:hypothetical protein